jgi:hypothetical protein
MLRGVAAAAVTKSVGHTFAASSGASSKRKRSTKIANMINIGNGGHVSSQVINHHQQPLNKQQLAN